MNINAEFLSTKIFGATIEFGLGVINNLPDHIESFNINKLLIVTDNGVIKAGILDKPISLLNQSGKKYAIFDRIQPNPTDENVMDGLSAYQSNNCDGILGIGGGSPIDAAKAIRVVSANKGHISEYYQLLKIEGKMPALIAVPTTSGTGTEVGTGGIITASEDNRKHVVRSGPPSLALIDPELTFSMPPFLTAATGIDALSHSVEAYVAKRYNPLASAIAIAGIKLVADNLRRAVKNGTDIEARKNMSMASTMGALAFTKGLGMSHSLSHQLSTDANVHHGVANAIMLPHVMEFNLELATQEYADIAYAMGVDTQGMSTIESARASVESVHRLVLDVELPHKLADAGVKEELIPIMASKAMEDHCHPLNPRECNYDSMFMIYKKAF